jgi:CDP-paratose 2-epimerase
MMRPTPNGSDRPLLIVGGAGFVGANLAHRALEGGERVRIFDNLSREGSHDNLRWLERAHGRELEVVRGDVRDYDDLRRAIVQTSAVIHCAAQVAVTSSLRDPREDFAINAEGTLNLLEALRQDPRPLVFTSTNKVYGDLGDIKLTIKGDRYVPTSPSLRKGIDESRPLSFRSPYGCSKGAADQYVLDYACSFGLPATVFRMSCVYGPRQHGNEDQGWVSHFLIAALRSRPITVYGDGRQVRDLLFVSDLADAVGSALAHIRDTAGRAFNIGGGPERVASPRELIALAHDITGREPLVQRGDWRVGDQRYYVSDTTAFRRLTGWQPRVDVPDGLARLAKWLESALPGQGSEASLALRARAAPRSVTFTSRARRPIAHDPREK